MKKITILSIALLLLKLNLYSQTLFSWGANTRGQLGVGNTTQIYSPQQLNADTWVSISAGIYHSLGKKKGGAIWVWGANYNGQLGLGNNTDYYTPQKFSNDTDWLSIQAGYYHTIGISKDGKLWAWGQNNYGQLGLGNNSNINIPKQVGTDKNWIYAHGGAMHTAGIKKNGTLWTWGFNYQGQLGLGNTENYSTPQQVGNDTNWINVNAGSPNTFGIKKNGTLWAWGANYYGQLGLGNTENYSTPQQVGNDSNWISIQAGYWHTLGIKKNGTLWAWGYNFNGQLGIGNTTEYNTPQQVGTDSNWISIQAGFDHSIGIKKDGTLWVWGKNINGQLGLSNTTQYTTPQQVGFDTSWLAIRARGDQSFGINSKSCINKFSIFTESIKNNNCFGENKGEVHLSHNGGNSPYLIRWSHDSKLNDSSALNLKAGIYKILYTDKWGACIDSLIVKIKDPQKLTSSLITQISPKCLDGNDGSAEISITGGTGSYSIFWNDNLKQKSKKISNLNSGTYLCKIIDSLGCMDSIAVTIPQSTKNKAKFKLHPAEQGAFSGNISYTVKSNDSIISYQWQINQGTSWTNLGNAGQFSGVNTDSLIVKNITILNDGQLFRCIIQSDCGLDTSREAKLSVWGVNTNSINKQVFILSPNPVKDILNIQGVQNTANYQITNAIGQTCLQGKFTEKLDVSALNAGVYFFITETGTQRFVKE